MRRRRRWRFRGSKLPATLLEQPEAGGRRRYGPVMPTHRAVQIPSANQPLTLVDVETSPPGPGHVRIAVAACGVCGTDHGFASGGFPGMTWPLTLGHEIAGTIAE